MIKLDISRLPGWVRWVAQDANGIWWAYEHEPNLADLVWYENEVGQQLKLGHAKVENDWRKTLKNI